MFLNCVNHLLVEYPISTKDIQTIFVYSRLFVSFVCLVVTAAHTPESVVELK